MKQSIQGLTRKDATSRHFVDWFFNMEGWIDAGATPENFDFSRLVHDEKSMYYVYGYFIDGKVEGIICLGRISDGMFIDMLFVNPEMQNWGIGSELMSHAIREFGAEYDMYLDVMGLNDGGLRLYDRFDFKKIKPFIQRELGTGAKRRCYTMRRVKGELEEFEPDRRPSRFLGD